MRTEVAMIRSPLRERPDDRPETGAARALEYELTGTWPTRAEYFRFWKGARVPSHLHEARRPDPRKVLRGEPGRLEHDREMAAWRAARLAWLEAQV
jgi:hypothetical protein